ncbi:hypothetical protein SRABI26_04610 [Arthrobacter sp. Bi26]|uniref:hypothetical protein n=1 Tax=Arthrobacter sp. Bi26 TaxID=2822350 RepID=UPI001D243089|nr:hypothetical protein [Arthrobacter sp. Bi26]CAH0303328.1 hypothetical protein SRABI26_04610 [Arthrobacter sp. Bi26]
MALSVVFHKVADYDEWRKVYDSVAELQSSSGVTQQSVHQLAGDPTPSSCFTTSIPSTRRGFSLPTQNCWTP